MKKTLKRLLSLFLAAVMLFGASPIGALSEIDFPSLRDLFTVEAEAANYSGTCGANLTWTLDDTTGELVISGTGDMTDWSDYTDVPWYRYRSLEKVTIENGVTSIGYEAFLSCTRLTSVTIPDSVTSIGDRAFVGCYSLTSVTIPDSVTSIGYETFAVCGFTSVTIPDSVTSIGVGAFEECDSLTSVTIPDSVTSIGYSAFVRCESLTSVIIGNSVESIGDYAFYDCYKLASVTIPDSVMSIGGRTFDSCDSLTSITVNENNAYYSNDEYGVLFNKDKTELIQYPIGNTRTSYTIPDSVTSIGSYAFSYCDNLTSITIPDSVTSIGNYTFAWCDSLTSVTIGNSVKSIGAGAFCDCDSLTDVYYKGTEAQWNAISIEDYGNDCLKNAKKHYNYEENESSTCGANLTWTLNTSTGTLTISGTGVMTNWSDYSFVPWYSYRSSIKSVTIGNSVTSIGDRAFFGCYSLTSVTIPDSVTSIGNYAFCSCNSLTSVTIGNSVTSIGDNAFYYCTGLTSITVDKNNAYYSSDEYGVLFNKDKTELIQYPIGIERTSYTIPDSVTSIGDYAFEGCDSLKSITIPDSVTSIGYAAFCDCYSLTSVTIGNGVKSIGEGAFYYCKSLTSVTIPDSVTSIGDCAFYSCDSLTSITIPDSVTSIGDYAFYNCNSLTDVYYAGSEEQWKAITIGYNNNPLHNATIHYNCTPVDFETNPGFRAIINSDRSYIFNEGGVFDTDSFDIELLIQNNESFIEGVTASQTSAVSAVVTLPQGFSFSKSSNVFAKQINFDSIAVGDSAKETLMVYVKDPEMEKPLQISAEVLKENTPDPIRKTFCSITATSDKSFLEFELSEDVYVANDERSADTATVSAQAAAEGKVFYKKNNNYYCTGVKSPDSEDITVEKNLYIKSGGYLTIKRTMIVKNNIVIENGGTLIVYGTLNCKGNITIKNGGTLEIKRGENYVGNEEKRGWVQAQNVYVNGKLILIGALYVFSELKCSNDTGKIKTGSYTEIKNNGDYQYYYSWTYAKKIVITAGYHDIDSGSFYTEGIKGNRHFKTTMFAGKNAEIILLYKDGVLPTVSHDWWEWPCLESLYVDEKIKGHTNEDDANSTIKNILNCSQSCYEVAVNDAMSSAVVTDILTPIAKFDQLRKEAKENAQNAVKLDPSILNEPNKLNVFEYTKYTQTLEFLKESIYLCREFLKSCSKDDGDLLDLRSGKASLDFKLKNGYRIIFEVTVNSYGNYGGLNYGTYVISKDNQTVNSGSIRLEAIYDLQAFGKSVDEYLAKEWNNEIAGYFGDDFANMLVKDVLFRYGIEKVLSVPLEGALSVAVQGALTNPRSVKKQAQVKATEVVETVLQTEEVTVSGASADIVSAQANTTDFDLTPKKGFEDKYLIQAVLSYLGLTSLDDLTDDIADSVTVLDLSNQNIKSVDGLQIFKNLQTLYIDNNFIYDLTPLEKLENLSYLSADRNCLMELYELENLQYLSVADCLIQNADAVNTMPELKYFDINTNYLLSLNSIFKAIGLIWLNISGNVLHQSGEVQEQSVTISSGSCAPTYLYMDECELSSLPDVDLSNVKVISASGNNLTLEENVSLPKAEEINFEDNEISDLGFVKNSSNLKKLNVKSNYISDITQDFANSAYNLEYLNLSDNPIRNTDENKELLNNISDKVDGVDIDNIGISATRIDFAVPNSMIGINDVAALLYYVYPAEANTDGFVWESSDTSVLSVDKGVITPHSYGTATVTVYENNEILGSTSVSVVDFGTVNVTDVILVDQDISLNRGDKHQMSAFLVPMIATNKSVSWSSSNDAVATVDENGLVTAKNAGTTIITVKTQDGDFTDSCIVTVTSNKCVINWIVDGTTTETYFEAGEGIVKPADPVKEGYIFKGWSPEVPEVMPAEDLTFTAVFEKVVPVSVRIVTAPTKLEYIYKQDNLNLSGIVLEVTYSDGTKASVTDTSLMTASGFTNEEYGKRTVTVEYEGLKASFDIKVKYAWWQWIIIILLFGWIWY